MSRVDPDWTFTIFFVFVHYTFLKHPEKRRSPLPLISVFLISPKLSSSLWPVVVFSLQIIYVDVDYETI